MELTIVGDRTCEATEWLEAKEAAYRTQDMGHDVDHVCGQCHQANVTNRWRGRHYMIH